MKNFDFLIVGGGIFGLATAVELALRKYHVGVINPATIPHPLAASTDISKIVRMEYGGDKLYAKMAEESIHGWHTWNDLFDKKVYHEVGFLMLCKEALENPAQKYEQSSYKNLLEMGYFPEKLDTETLSKRYPAVNSQHYTTGIFNPKGGFVESSEAIRCLLHYAVSLGVSIHEYQTAKEFIIEKNRLKGVKTVEGETYHCQHAIIAAGANTPYLIPELQPYMKSTGHPVFWVQPQKPEKFEASKLPVFTGDISNSGWYGFPFLPDQGVIKIGRHTEGIGIDPSRDDRYITSQEIKDLRDFLQKALPDLSEAPIVYSRRCLYTDTLDGHYWIDVHPEIEGLSVSTGGSGHAMKMGPVLGKITADIVEGKHNPFAHRFKWRHLSENTVQVEEARYLSKNEL